MTTSYVYHFFLLLKHTSSIYSNSVSFLSKFTFEHKWGSDSLRTIENSVQFNVVLEFLFVTYFHLKVVCREFLRFATAG